MAKKNQNGPASGVSPADLRAVYQSGSWDGLLEITSSLVKDRKMRSLALLYEGAALARTGKIGGALKDWSKSTEYCSDELAEEFCGVIYDSLVHFIDNVVDDFPDIGEDLMDIDGNLWEKNGDLGLLEPVLEHLISLDSGTFNVGCQLYILFDVFDQYVANEDDPVALCGRLDGVVEHASKAMRRLDTEETELLQGPCDHYVMLREFLKPAVDGMSADERKKIVDYWDDHDERFYALDDIRSAAFDLLLDGDRDAAAEKMGTFVSKLVRRG